MALEVRKNKFARWYENAYFRVLANKLVGVFDELRMDGVIIGSGYCDFNPGLQPDVLVVCESAVIIIDLKKYGGHITLPESCIDAPSRRKDRWYQGKWIFNNDPNKFVRGGSRKNPFQQLEAQTSKMNELIENRIVPNLNNDENCESKHTQRVVCFQLDVDFEGEIDPRYQHNFHVADPRSIVNKIKDIIDIAPHEYNGEIAGYKLGVNAFNLFKNEFKADLFEASAENKLYQENEFSEIKFPEIDIANRDAIVEEEFISLHETIEPFICGEKKLLVVNGDVTSFSNEFVQKTLAAIIERENSADKEEDEYWDQRVCYLAPTNKNVNDVVRDGAPQETSSLYGKLYDFEHSTIKLLSNSINEQEQFPLQKNMDQDGTIYVLFYSHLVYDFGEGDEEALVKFGSGSLCNDTLNYVDMDNSKNRLILVNDPYNYGFRADTISNDHILSANNIEYISVSLESRPINPKGSSIAYLRNNLDNNRLNIFNFSEGTNVSSFSSDQFRNRLSELVDTNEINSVNVLTREKSDAESTNSWIRNRKNCKSSQIEAGDVILIKGGRVIVPEEQDPFAIPKFVNTGDIAEVVQIDERFSFKSSEYNLPEPIEIVQCKVYLRQYDVERTLYISASSISDVTDFKEFKKHRQIRLRELVQNYMEENDIHVKDVFMIVEEYESYQKELDAITKNEGLFEGEDLNEEELDKETLDKKVKKLNSKWKINKRKERYVKSELLSDFNSEYFKITQAANYQYGWALNLRNAYGYNFEHCLLPSYQNRIKNISRFHAYLYSSLVISDRITFQAFTSINPWFEVYTRAPLPSPTSKKKGGVYTVLEERELTTEEKRILTELSLENFDSRLAILANWVLNQFKPEDAITVDTIKHHSYQEEYLFRNSQETSRVQFIYNGKWQLTRVSQIGSTELGSLIEERCSNTTAQVDEFPFIGDLSWNLKEYSKLNDLLQPVNIVISKIDSHNFMDRIGIVGESCECELDMYYNGDNFFTKLAWRSTTSTELCDSVLQAIKQLQDG